MYANRVAIFYPCRVYFRFFFILIFSVLYRPPPPINPTAQHAYRGRDLRSRMSAGRGQRVGGQR